jgi:hypothetical protein
MQPQVLNCHRYATLQEYHSSCIIKHWTLWCPLECWLKDWQRQSYFWRLGWLLLKSNINMTSTSASTIFQMTIISYITKILKWPSENRTPIPKQFSQDTKLPQEIGQFYKSRTKFSTQFKQFNGRKNTNTKPNSTPQTVTNLNLWSTDMAIHTFLPYLPNSCLLTTK